MLIRIENSGLKSRLLYCFRFQVFVLDVQAVICQKQAHFLSAQMYFLTKFFQVFIVLEIYNLNISRKSHTTAVNTSSKSSEKFQLL